MTARICSLNLRVQPRRQFRADFRHRQPHFGAVDQSGAPQPVLDRRRARLGEQQSREVGDGLPARRAASRSPAANQLAANLRRKFRSRYAPTPGCRRRRRRSALRYCASSPVSMAKFSGRRQQQLERLRAVGAAILQADDVGMRGQLQHRRVAEIDAGPVGNVVEHDRMGGAIGQCFEVQRIRAARAANNRGRKSGSRRSAMPRSRPACPATRWVLLPDRPRQIGRTPASPGFVPHREYQPFEFPAAQASGLRRGGGEDQSVDGSAA
jgi:hypothetical protein